MLAVDFAEGLGVITGLNGLGAFGGIEGGNAFADHDAVSCGKSVEVTNCDPGDHALCLACSCDRIAHASDRALRIFAATFG